MSCLRTPLTQVPAGEWYCELCQERQAAGGDFRLRAAFFPMTQSDGGSACAEYAAALS